VTDLPDGSGIIEHVRRVKSPKEIEYIRQAGRYRAASLQAAIDAIAPGKTDSDVAASRSRRSLRVGPGHRRLLRENEEALGLVDGDEPLGRQMRRRQDPAVGAMREQRVEQRVVARHDGEARRPPTQELERLRPSASRRTITRVRA